MERAAARAGRVLFFNLPLISGSSVPIGIGSNYSSLYEQNILPCKKEELQCGNGLCLLNWLRCHYKKDCGRDYMSIKLTCSKVHLNHSSAASELPSYSEHGADASLLVSPLLVAGVVIGLVLFLSCVTIIVGSLRKDGRLRHTQLRRDASYAPDGFSYGGSFGELRSTCMEEFPPAFEFGSYLETLSRVSVMYPDSPPRPLPLHRPDQSHYPPCAPVEADVGGEQQNRYFLRQGQADRSSCGRAAPSAGYDECVGPGATRIHIPRDDPPPYSLTDPCPGSEAPAAGGAAAAPGATARAAGPQPQRLPPAAPSPRALEAAPRYEAALREHGVPSPRAPADARKNPPTDYQTLRNQIL